MKLHDHVYDVRCKCLKWPKPRRWMAASLPVNALTPLQPPPTSPTWYIPPRRLCSTVLHLYKVRTAFQAFKQHPRSLYESAHRRLPLIDFPRDTSCPPPPRSSFPVPDPDAAGSRSEASSEDSPDTGCSVCLASWTQGLRPCVQEEGER